MKKISLRELMIASALAAFSATAQLIHIGYQSPQWGMWIDIVAVSWFIAYFLFGFRVSLVVTLIGTLMITLFAPDTWLGASMKFVATVPLIITLFLNTKLRKINLSGYKQVKRLIVPVAAGIIIRCLLVIPLNYYYAIPIWTGMSPTQAIAAIPWYIIAGFNAVQTVIDVFLAWVLVHKFRLSRYSDINAKNE